MHFVYASNTPLTYKMCYYLQGFTNYFSQFYLQKFCFSLFTQQFNAYKSMHVLLCILSQQFTVSISAVGYFKWKNKKCLPLSPGRPFCPLAPGNPGLPGGPCSPCGPGDPGRPASPGGPCTVRTETD